MTNINDTAACNALIAKGWTHFTVSPRGENKGAILSKHKTRRTAEKAAIGRDRAICDADHIGWF